MLAEETLQQRYLKTGWTQRWVLFIIIMHEKNLYTYTYYINVAGDIVCTKYYE